LGIHKNGLSNRTVFGVVYVGAWSYNDTTGLLTMQDNHSYKIKFINDRTMIVQLRHPDKPEFGSPWVMDKVPLRKAITVTKAPKRSRSSGGMSKNAKLYYDWLVKRELGDPGPIPKVSNFDRKEALLYWKLLIGGQPTPEIRYGR
jgi:hypothetical protein